MKENLKTTEYNKAVAITFDDGPNMNITPKILQFLEETGFRATFSVVGSMAAECPGLLRRMLSANCEIVNHSWSHERFLNLKDDDIYCSIRKTDIVIFHSCGILPKFIRVPYGLNDKRIKDIAESMNKAVLCWSLNPMDWKEQDASVIIHSVLDNVSDGDVILLHDTHKSTYEAILTIMPELIRRGYDLITVSEMLERKNTQFVPGRDYFFKSFSKKTP